MNVILVLFDFDGTLSLIREGWPEVMLPMFEELLPRVEGESPDAVRAMLWDDIMTLNGRQTIYQMMKFAERVTERVAGRGTERIAEQAASGVAGRVADHVAKRGSKRGSIRRGADTFVAAPVARWAAGGGGLV